MGPRSLKLGGQGPVAEVGGLGTWASENPNQYKQSIKWDNINHPTAPLL